MVGCDGEGGEEVRGWVFDKGGRGVGLDWIGLDWIGLGWVGLDWIGLDWVGLGWVGLECGYIELDRRPYMNWMRA